MKKILIIEDDEVLLETLGAALESENFKILTTRHGKEGLQLALQEAPDLIVADWVLPGMTGLDICKALRAQGKRVPVILLSGKKKEEVDKVIGLEIGADDYLTKPFGTREFTARVKAVLRRAEERKGKEEELGEVSFGDVTLHFKKQTAHKGGRKIHLTSKEFELLRYLISNEGEVVSRERILNEVWGYDKFPTTRTVDTFLHNLRKKIEDVPSRPRHLLTVPWAGYKFQK